MGGQSVWEVKKLLPIVEQIGNVEVKWINDEIWNERIGWQ